ncbi:hypothetical protein B0H14DRAFT_3170094 [Mycena olivaceomarginata]|nr:hypothetical protein B0H14DRAFT_3170094 [Mycena olivaceomarginata]
MCGGRVWVGFLPRHPLLEHCGELLGTLPNDLLVRGSYFVVQVDAVHMFEDQKMIGAVSAILLKNKDKTLPLAIKNIKMNISLDRDHHLRLGLRPESSRFASTRRRFSCNFPHFMRILQSRAASDAASGDYRTWEILGRHPDSRWPVLISDSNVHLVRVLAYDALFFVPLLVGLIISIIFCVATLLKSPTTVFRQKIAFLGRCKQVTPLYTPLSILLNRSIARPLRAGSNIIIVAGAFAGAFILSCIVLGVPTFGFYAIVLMPLRAQIYIRDVTNLENIEVEYAPGNVTFCLKPFVLGNGDVDYSTAAMGVEDERGNCSATWMWGACMLGVRTPGATLFVWSDSLPLIRGVGGTAEGRDSRMESSPAKKIRGDLGWRAGEGIGDPFPGLGSGPKFDINLGQKRLWTTFRCPTPSSTLVGIICIYRDQDSFTNCGIYNHWRISDDPDHPNVEALFEVQ